MEQLREVVWQDKVCTHSWAAEIEKVQMFQLQSIKLSAENKQLLQQIKELQSENESQSN